MVLLHAGADFDLCSSETGDAAIHLAAREGLLGLAQSLCAFGCAVDISNKVLLEIILTIAILSNFEEIILSFAPK